MISNIFEQDSRYILGSVINTGIFGTIYEATDTKIANKKVAIKVQQLISENEKYIQEEYQILNNYTNHLNLIDFYGTYSNGNEIWFVMEFCEGGTILDLVRGFKKNNRRMIEEHIAFILKETIKALVYLHDNKIMHRNICGSNILLTKDGEIKLIDFNLSCNFEEPKNLCIGPPYYLAPEMIACIQTDNTRFYGSKVDVWALGITAIELADAQPFTGMHPTKIMFQVTKNPPPGLKKPTEWSEMFNDFIAECLEKNPDFRPNAEELIKHPFLDTVPGNYFYLTQELKKLIEDFVMERHISEPDPIIISNLLKISQNTKPKRMYFEDLAVMENLNEEIILSELEGRINLNSFHTFIGDVLLILNPNKTHEIYDDQYHLKYKGKSRSDNPPHVFSIADKAYQDASHHETVQHIVVTGEGGSGKTTAYLHVLDHLLFLGYSSNIICEQIKSGINLIHALTNASTPINPDSTRCVMKTQIHYGSTGKVTGAIFNVYQLEKWRVTFMDESQGNYHIFYYFYDSIKAKDELQRYILKPDQNYQLLRISPGNKRNANSEQFQIIINNLKVFNLHQYEETICKILSAILNLGEIQFQDNENMTEIKNPDVVANVAQLLSIDERKFTWALLNYCLVEEGIAIHKRNNCDEAKNTRDSLANCLYVRLVDWIVNKLNSKMQLFNKVTCDQKYSINVLDFFGFECFKQNDLEQLLINTFNEQIQYIYNQRIFAWEFLDQLENDLKPIQYQYYDNKIEIDKLLEKTNGVLSLIDKASKTERDFKHIIDEIVENCTSSQSKNGFNFPHYTGKVDYDITNMLEKNRNFLSFDLINTLRQSTNEIIQECFTKCVTQTGNLYYDLKVEKNKWITTHPENIKKTIVENIYSQTKYTRTAIAIFRAISLEILRVLSVGAGSGNTHFIRCIRTNVKSEPHLKQQIRNLNILETAKARYQGYPYRIEFSEFLRRYKFLAFDFNENVEINTDNCRLLLVRLKMEGWLIGKSKVFLKYYNEEYLSRLYEFQIQKIIKIQSIMRTLITKRSIISKLQKLKVKTEPRTDEKQFINSEITAALRIQKAFRGYNIRKRYGSLINKESNKLDNDTAEFIKPFYKKWKNKTIFQILLQYRAIRFQDLINLSQQIHLFNQNVVHHLSQNNNPIDESKIDSNARTETWIGPQKCSVWKLPFYFDDIPFYDTESMRSLSSVNDEDSELWDAPLQWHKSRLNQITFEMKSKLFESKATDHELPITKQPTTEQKQINQPQKTTKHFDKKPTGCDWNSERANQDFEYIKPEMQNFVKLKHCTKPTDPIAELESIGRRTCTDTDTTKDEPPFNFQQLLRKTQFQRSTVKHFLMTGVENKNKVNQAKKTEFSNVIRTELAPGIILKGEETQL